MNLEIATRLAQLRKANGLSQEALAEKLGVSRQAISKWERAESSPDTDNLMALASLYGMTLDTLLNAKNDTYILNGTPEESEQPTSAPEPLPKTELQKKGAALLKFPFPIIAVLLYLAIGYFLHAWHPGWLVFLLIPIYYQLAAALTVRKPKARLLTMPVPEIVVLLYLFFGVVCRIWHPTWVLFLGIPLYYWLVACFYKDKTEDTETK